MVLKKAHLILGTALTLPFIMGFVLLSGPEEAKLPVSPSAPTITFLLSPEHPRFTKKDEFLGGAYANLSDEEFWRTLVQETMAVWNNVEGAYVQLNVQVDPAATIDSEDRVFSIVDGNLPATAAASALPQHENGIIYDCDITVSSGKTEARDLAYTMLHELGHCLGLGHNHSNYNAVMGYSRESRSLYLSADDKAGIIYLYRDPSMAKPKEMISCGVIPGKGRASGWSLFLMLAPIGVLLWKRLRRPF